MLIVLGVFAVLDLGPFVVFDLDLFFVVLGQNLSFVIALVFFADLPVPCVFESVNVNVVVVYWYGWQILNFKKKNVKNGCWLLLKNALSVILK